MIKAVTPDMRGIAGAITEAHKRGLHVEIILDKRNETAKYSSADFAAHAGIPWV